MGHVDFSNLPFFAYNRRRNMMFHNKGGQVNCTIVLDVCFGTLYSLRQHYTTMVSIRCRYIIRKWVVETYTEPAPSKGLRSLSKKKTTKTVFGAHGTVLLGTLCCMQKESDVRELSSWTSALRLSQRYHKLMGKPQIPHCAQRPLGNVQKLC